MMRKSNSYARYDPYGNMYSNYGFNTPLSGMPGVNSFFGTQGVSPVSSVPMMFSQSPMNIQVYNYSLLSSLPEILKFFLSYFYCGGGKKIE
jgi:hypothetical protein